MDLNIKNLMVSPSPHTRDSATVQSIMMDVIIALMPAVVIGVYYFGAKAAYVIMASTLSCVLFEWLWTKMCKKESTGGDLSAVVTGLLLGMNMPPSIPIWMVVIGSLFAIIIVKQFFGGIGHNFVNPALAARAFMLAAWPVAMTFWTEPFKGVDAVSSVTVLQGMQNGNIPLLWNLLIGNMAGCIGETCAIALILGGLYLVLRRIITLRIPLTYIGTVFLFMLLYKDVNFAVAQILSGGLMLGAIFMATDYVTSPVTSLGQIIMGIGCGLMTSVIRIYGGYPEGVTYAILFMNCITPIINSAIKPKKYGEVRHSG